MAESDSRSNPRSEHRSGRATEGRPGGTVALALRTVGGALLLPLLILAFAGLGRFERVVDAASAELIGSATDAARAPGEPETQRREISLRAWPEATAWRRGAAFDAAGAVEIALRAPLSRLRLRLQARAENAMRVLARANDSAWREIHRFEALPGRAGLQTRSSPALALDPAITRLRFEGVAGPTPYAVGGVELSARPHAGWLLPLALPPLAWLLLLAAARREDARARGALEAWSRFDPVVLGLGAALVLFDSGAWWLACALVAALALLLRLLARAPLPALASLGLIAVLAVFALPRIFGAAVRNAVARSHELSVDHRMRPDGAEINADGLRFLGSAEQLQDEDFVILVMGDSFAYGWKLAYEATPAAVLERALAPRCEAPVRTVNLGWTSSSPLLGLRLLQEIGPRYRPDLIVYLLDMTDFHDDLRYEAQLRLRGDFEPDTSRVLFRLLRTAAPGLPLAASDWGALAALARDERGEAAEAPSDGLPRDRFFVTSAPLASTREAIERGVVENLAALDAFARETLRADFALVLYPRAYQYSLRESPRNWEDDQYQRLGPNVRAPFAYFAERAASLPYPVIDLFDAFAGHEGAPLFFEDDPHWNADGARLAADRIGAALRARGLLRCESPGSEPQRAAAPRSP